MGAVVTVAVIGVVASLQTLPTAQVTLTPRTATIGPLPLTITALTTVSEPDPETGRLPAVDVAIPLSTEQTYPATGREVVEARATGSVVLTSPDQPFEQLDPGRHPGRSPRPGWSSGPPSRWSCPASPRAAGRAR